MKPDDLHRSSKKPKQEFQSAASSRPGIYTSLPAIHLRDRKPPSEAATLAQILRRAGSEVQPPILARMGIGIDDITPEVQVEIQRRAAEALQKLLVSVESSEKKTSKRSDGVQARTNFSELELLATCLPNLLNFPLGLYKGSDEDKRTMQLKELNNGRLAMIAIPGYAFNNKAATKIPVFNSGS